MSKLVKHPPDTKEVQRLRAEGLKCIMWDIQASEMDKQDLLAFVGFLNELLCLCVKREGPYRNV